MRDQVFKHEHKGAVVTQTTKALPSFYAFLSVGGQDTTDLGPAPAHALLSVDDLLGSVSGLS